jgi:hypothetical protein
MLGLLGLLGLLIDGYALVGRPPDLDLMRGIGPLSLAVIAVGLALLALALVLMKRRITARPGIATGLAVATAAAALAATALIVRHPLGGHAEFRHDPAELAATRALLWCAAALFVALWQWQGTAEAFARNREGRGPAAALAAAARARLAPLGAPLANVTLVVISMVIGGLLCEAAFRLINGIPLFDAHNLVAERIALLKTETMAVYDPLLGWVDRENRKSDPPGSFTTGRYGVRMNGPDIEPLPERAILAVGDSFTVGSEVANAEAWPAQLQARLGEPVVNAAVGGYGSDQIVLRAETMIPILHPSRVIVSFLFDDVDRAAQRVYSGGNKPYFTVSDGKLVLHNTPVPQFGSRPDDAGWLRGILGYSYLVAFAMQQAGLYEWWFRAAYVSVDIDPAEVSCLLLARLKAQTDAAGIPLAFIMQYGASHILAGRGESAKARRVLDCAAAAGIQTIDTWDALAALAKRDAPAFRALFVTHPPPNTFGHMSGAGNALIAGLLAAAIKP